jgi:hypothetical protein
MVMPPMRICAEIWCDAQSSTATSRQKLTTVCFVNFKADMAFSFSLRFRNFVPACGVTVSEFFAGKTELSGVLSQQPYFLIKYAFSPPVSISIRVSLSSVPLAVPPSAIVIVALSFPEAV